MAGSHAGAVYFSESFVLSYTVQNLCFPRQLVKSIMIRCRKSKHNVLLVDESLIWLAIGQYTELERKNNAIGSVVKANTPFYWLTSR